MGSIWIPIIVTDSAVVAGTVEVRGADGASSSATVATLVRLPVRLLVCFGTTLSRLTHVDAFARKCLTTGSGIHV